MSWAGISSNQTVSFNNLQDAVTNGIFSQKTSIPASNEQITKTDADTYVNIDTSYGPYSSKSSNQLVVKSNLTPAVTPTPTTTPTPTPTQTLFSVNWTFTQSATAGTCQISKNGTLQVNVTATSSGSFTYTAGDYIEVYGDSSSTFLIARINIYITDGSGTLYNNYQDGSGFISLSTSTLYPTGNCYIDVTASEY